MLEFYPQIREVHIAAITVSLIWFGIRALSLALGMRWPWHLAARIPGWVIDGSLLTAATMLWTILPVEVFANHWLAVKLGLVAVYLGASWMALQPGLGKGRFLGLSAAAVIAWTLVYGIARAHDPLGWFV